jgi:coatomer protein complex subunit alpha (xenin)
VRLLQLLPFVVVQSKEEEAELRQFCDLGREYVIATMLEQEKKKEGVDGKQVLQYTYLMTHCKLQTAHVLLTLHSAMVAAFKAENFIDAAVFANRVLMNADIKSPKNAMLEQKARKVRNKSEREGRNKQDLQYDAEKPLVIDCTEFAPVYKSELTVKCPYCSASYKSNKKKILCKVCGLAQVGLETVGLVCMNSRK